MRRYGPVSSVALGLASVATLATLSGCRGCANDHPYVPPPSKAPVVTNADASAPALPVADIAVDGGGSGEPALVAPPNTTTWRVEGMTLEAGGRELVLAILRDFDGDGQKDALAIIRPPAAELKPGTATGELVFFHGADRGGAGNAPTPMAGAIAAGPALGLPAGCAPTARLERIGPASAYAEIGSVCPRAGAGARSIVVVRGGGGVPSVAFDAVVVDPPLAPKLSVDAEAVDRDKDGIDDVVLRIGIEGMTARLAFFDRPAGPGRDPEEPEASLKAIASPIVSKAAKVKEAPATLALVQQMRALYRAMCAEGGAPRITRIHGGSAVTCGPSKPLEDAGVAEVRAFALQGDALRAFAAAEIAQAAPASRTAAKTAELQKILGEVAPSVTPANVRTLAAIPDTPSDHHPEWGPIAFEHSSKLLVRRGKSVTRVDPESGEGEAADMVPWKDEVLSPDGKHRWIEAYHACEGVALRATFAPVADGDMHELPLPIPPRLGKSCAGSRGEPATAIPIAWGPRGLEALVAGQPVLLKTDPPSAAPLPAFFDEGPPPGSPRAHGGKSLALGVLTGVLVRGPKVRGEDRGERWMLVKSPDLEPYTELRRCTVNDDASKLACVRRGKVVLATLP